MYIKGIMLCIKNDIRTKNQYIQTYVTEMKKIRQELVSEMRKVKSLYEEDVKVENVHI